MTISVIIPCFNHGRYLEEAVESVFAQTVQDFEIVIVNDGSTDPDTRRLLANYDRPRTRVVHIENRGLPGARNAGIRETSRPLICALDADDILEPKWFERALEVIEADPDVAFVSHWLKTFGDEEWEWTPDRCDLVSLLDRNTVNGAAVVRREAIEAVGFFDETMRDGCEDWDLWIRMVEQGYRGVIIPEFLFRYRRRPDSMSRAMNRPAVQLGLFRELIRKHEQSYQQHLLDLLQRRATNLCDLRGEIWDLEREVHQWWAPELARRKNEVVALRRKVALLRGGKHDVPELSAPVPTPARVDGAHSNVRGVSLSGGENAGVPVPSRSGATRAGLQADLEGHQRALANASAEIASLRASWSWRLTAPLRAVAGWFMRPGGDR